MQWWNAAHQGIGAFFREHSLLAAFFLLLVEEAGVPSPIPGDVFMLVLGVRARAAGGGGDERAALDLLWQTIVVLEGATVLGATLLYGVSRWAGRSVAYRYGKYLHLTPARLTRAEAWLRRHGALAIVVARLVPGLRIATAMVCGALDVPFVVFLPAMSFGALLYILLYVGLGYLIGPPALAVLERFHLPLETVGAVAVATILVVWTVRSRRALFRRHRVRGHVFRAAARRAGAGYRVRAGAIAGALAAVGAVSLGNAGGELAGWLSTRAGMESDVLLTPAAVAERMARVGGGQPAEPVVAFLVLSEPAVFVVSAVVWGAIYGAWAERRLQLHDLANGLVYGLLPLALALASAAVALAHSRPGAAPMGLVAVAESARHLAYGAFLGAIYPVLLARRLPRPPAPAQPSGASTLASSTSGDALADSLRAGPMDRGTA